MNARRRRHVGERRSLTALPNRSNIVGAVLHQRAAQLPSGQRRHGEARAIGRLKERTSKFAVDANE